MTEARLRTHARLIAAAHAGTRPRQPWPFPGDTPLDRSRTLARGLLAALARHDPAEADTFADRATTYGETWLRPAGLAPTGSWLTAQQAADLIGAPVSRIYGWTSRRRLTRHPEGYLEAEVWACARSSRRAPATTIGER